MEFTNEKYYAIAIRSLEGVGDVYAREIFERVRPVENFFLSNEKELLRILNNQEWVVRAIKSREKGLKEAERIMSFCTRHRLEVIHYFDSVYPRRLFYLPDAPFIIYYFGTCCWDKDYSIAIVGTRSPDGYGQKMTCSVVQQLKEYDPLIVSGMALGVDGYAHFTALKCGLKTIGVMGHGLDIIYPPQHKKLAKNILDQGGMLVSEFAPGTQPEPQYFPRRNRIVAGMSDALLVVQSRMKGGSMITATLAHSYNKDVFAIPGLCGEPLSEGTNGLIKMNKAALVESGEDIAMFMNWRKKNSEPVAENKKIHQAEIPLGQDEEAILQLKFRKRIWYMDEIIQELNVPYSKIAQTLTLLELNGMVKKNAGNIIEFF